MNRLTIGMMAGFLCLAGTVFSQTETNHLPVITLKTRLPNDEETAFPYRVPANYDPKGREVHRVLINCVWQTTVFDRWADEHGAFILHAIFKDPRCWKVKDGFGQVILDGLQKLKKEYRVAADQIFVYGISRGGQLSSFLVSWKPELVTAWISHIPGIMDEPNLRMKDIPGIVTAGEGDDGRYQVGTRFMEQARKLHLTVIWRSYANAGHEVPGEAIEMSKAFFTFHHERTKDILQRGRSRFASNPDAALTKPRFVGDAQEWKYFPVESDEARGILEEHRVELPTEEIARVWTERESVAESME